MDFEHAENCEDKCSIGKPTTTKNRWDHNYVHLIAFILMNKIYKITGKK